MATRTIPSDVRPHWTCTVNGKKYTYESGATVDVPDGVAAVIDAINEGKPKKKTEAMVQQLPTPTEVGKVLVSDYAGPVMADGSGQDKMPPIIWKEGDAPGGGGGGQANPVFSVTGEYRTMQDGKSRIALNVTAQELYVAIHERGQNISLGFDIAEGVPVTSDFSMVAVKVAQETYQFYAYTNKKYASPDTEADDAVILFED